MGLDTTNSRTIHTRWLGRIIFQRGFRIYWRYSHNLSEPLIISLFMSLCTQLLGCSCFGFLRLLPREDFESKDISPDPRRSLGLFHSRLHARYRTWFRNRYESSLGRCERYFHRCLSRRGLRRSRYFRTSLFSYHRSRSHFQQYPRNIFSSLRMPNPRTLRKSRTSLGLVLHSCPHRTHMCSSWTRSSLPRFPKLPRSHGLLD